MVRLTRDRDCIPPRTQTVFPSVAISSSNQTKAVFLAEYQNQSQPQGPHDRSLVCTYIQHLARCAQPVHLVSQLRTHALGGIAL